MSEEKLTPRSNPMFFGHEQAKELLLEGYTSGKLAHGWLISGPRGIGKATLAYHFARMLLAGSDAMDIGESDPVFRRMIADSHSDFRVVEPIFDPKKEEAAREITIEQAREIGQFLSLTPGESKWRVVIVDSIDALNVKAANAILKILEEPPPQAILMLISHNPGALLPTIRSRCRQLRLNGLTDAEFGKILRNIAPEIDSSLLPALREMSDRSPGIALELFEQEAMDVYADIVRIVSSLPKLDAKKLHSFADSMGTGQVHAQWRLFMHLMLFLLATTVKSASGGGTNPIIDGEGAAIAQLCALHSAATWAVRWQQSQEQFLLAYRRHLDYKQVIITFFHSLASKDGFKLGSTAA